MQSAMKDIVCYIYENDLNSAVYFSLQIIAVIFSHLLAALFGKKLGLQIKQAALAVMIEVAIVYIEMAVLCVLVAVITPSNIPVMNSYYNNVGRTFVLVPFSAMLISKLLKQDLKIIASIDLQSLAK